MGIGALSRHGLKKLHGPLPLASLAECREHRVAAVPIRIGRVLCCCHAFDRLQRALELGRLRRWRLCLLSALLHVF